MDNKKNNNESYCLNPPRQMVFVDCETYPFETDVATGVEQHMLHLWCAHYIYIAPGKLAKQEWKTGTTSGEFWNWISSRIDAHHQTYVFAHNALFDFRVLDLWQNVSDGFLELTKTHYDNAKHRKESPLIIMEEPPTIIKLYMGYGKKLIICDTMNYFRMPLDELGESVGVKKLDMPRFDDHIDKWEKYCRNDVEIIRKAIMQLVVWCSDNGPNAWRLTAAGIAKSILDMKHAFKVWPSPADSDDRKFERECLYHGLIEVYRKDEMLRETIYHLDVSSLYPSIMLDPVPVELIASGDQLTLMELMAADPRCHIAEVLVKTNIEPLPSRGDRGKPRYLNGNYVTVICGDELQRAVDMNQILEVRRWHRYRMKPVYHQFVTDLWSARMKYEQQGNGAFADLCKLMLNSSYGKISQKSGEWQLIDEEIAPKRDEPFGTYFDIDLIHKKLHAYRFIDGYCWKNCGNQEMEISSPVVTAFIAAGARERMHRLRQAAGRQNVYYQAVDALFTNDAGYQHLRRKDEIARREIGKLKVVEVAERAYFLDKNHYEFGDKVVCSGLQGSPHTKTESGKYLEEIWSSGSDYLDNYRFPVVTVHRHEREI